MSISPYTYVANNPINFLDPDGARIDSTSQAEWNDLKGSVEKKHERLNNRLQNRVEKGKNTKGLEKRVAHLEGTLNELHDMEVVQDVTYKLNNLGSEATVGFVEKDNAGSVVINYTNSVGNFVHEAKHGAQFLSGEIDFASSGKPIYMDLYDEVAAYKAEYAYTGSSNYNKVTTNWVYNLTDQKTGNSPYQAPYYSQFRVNKNTNKYLFPVLYPNIKFQKDFLNTIPLHLRLKN